MDVLVIFVYLLPELHVYGSIQLDQPGGKVHMPGLRVFEVDGVSCCCLVHAQAGAPDGVRLLLGLLLVWQSSK